VASIKDIASRAGISSTTVSHVLNKSRHVHPETEARVLKAIRELDYKPNMLARSLRRRQTSTIGLLVSDIENPFFTEVARAVETTAYERGYNVILCNTDEDLAKEIMYVDVLFAKQVDGLILAPAPGDHSFLRGYMERGARVVCVNRYTPDVPSPAVICDDEHAMFELASQLLNQHSYIGAIIGLETVSTTVQRLAGLRRALELKGQTLNDCWIFPGQARQEGGYQAAREISRLTRLPTAVVALNSLMLDGFLLGLLEMAPHLFCQLEVTGFGYSNMARVCHPPRYYVQQPSHQVGCVATNLLLDILTDVVLWNTDHIVLKNSLVQLGASAVMPSPVTADRSWR